ncbi:hypothetical protein BDZ45DRAFT_745068 [Acephala macrosclerotiorum]|nr:hypothetical protein BDZ45DRAFT_745068 [Acephala macrosclerotiorum]
MGKTYWEASTVVVWFGEADTSNIFVCKVLQLKPMEDKYVLVVGAPLPFNSGRGWRAVQKTIVDKAVDNPGSGSGNQNYSSNWNTRCLVNSIRLSCHYPQQGMENHYLLFMGGSGQAGLAPDNTEESEVFCKFDSSSRGDLAIARKLGTKYVLVGRALLLDSVYRRQKDEIEIEMDIAGLQILSRPFKSKS